MDYNRKPSFQCCCYSEGFKMRGSGGTDGGIAEFVIGTVLTGAAVYLFFDSVRVGTGHPGFLSGLISGGGGQGRGMGGLGETTSSGILFIPFFLGIFSLFVNARQKWAWYLTYFGIAILAVEIFSRMRFFMETKLTHLMLMLTLLAAGVALIFRSYRDKSIARRE
jgi:hypothetical protein